MKLQRPPNAAEKKLGISLQNRRLICGLTQRQLGRIINKTEQQIRKYEAGAFVSLPVLEAIAIALSDPIQKRIIRRISTLRKLEEEHETEYDELDGIYAELFSDEL